ncbi:thiamine-phosphate synthase [Marmoricola endophyticus]|uniref:Thiamine-phosphate synthase n=1 Tax=Marmoricola endophyticus TaxID=2040280 RepID=A0A917BGA4_9ACTN|nr:thiamine phosphate synthase [Marmoricola endophyticus]GGF39554.1 thiamine-phosphate synthase [Marmoricola endophyticus]
MRARTSLDLAVYLVTDPVLVGGRDLVDVVAAAVAGGVGTVQLRDKQATTEQLVAQLDRLRTVVGDAALVVNDDLAAAAYADGVHVGADDVLPTVARERLGPEAVVGWSLHDLAQLDDAEQLAAIDYLAVSPVHATTTKPDHDPPFGLDGVRAVVDGLAARGVDLPVIGIGGLDAGNAAEVVAAGGAGVAVVSAICAAPDPTAAAREIREALR